MNAWRWTVAVGLIALAGVPLALPFAEAFFEANNSEIDVAHLGTLAANTFILTAGAVGVALPVGILLAVLIFRTNLPGRWFFLIGTVFAVFVPLPVIVSAWQALLGSDGLFPLWLWGANASRPWSEGLLPGIWLHGLAGLPWVTLIVGIGLKSVESELEEEALLAARPCRVLARVTLPRCLGSIAAAALWVALQTAGDINVAAILQVPTFAEEIDKQFNMGGAGLAQATLLTLPPVLAMWALLMVAAPRWERAMLPLQLGFIQQSVFALGKSKWIVLLLCVLAAAAIVAVPLFAPLWKLGLAGTPRAWSPANAGHQFVAELHLFGFQVLDMLLVACATGALAAILALVVSWTAQSRRPLRVLVLATMTLAWVLPGPLVGIGLKDTIMAMVKGVPLDPLHALLYYGPSPVPIIWADLLRFFPYAVAIVWPAVRLVPTELVDAARLEGAKPWQELWHVYVPMTRRSLIVAALAVTALSLGEVGTSARVETPKWESFAKLILDRMHYGADSNVAALSLVLLAGISVAFLLCCLIRWCWRT